MHLCWATLSNLICWLSNIARYASILFYCVLPPSIRAVNASENQTVLSGNQTFLLMSGWQTTTLKQSKALRPRVKHTRGGGGEGGGGGGGRRSRNRTQEQRNITEQVDIEAGKRRPRGHRSGPGRSSLTKGVVWQVVYLVPVWLRPGCPGHTTGLQRAPMDSVFGHLKKGKVVNKRHCNEFVSIPKAH